jgi:group I intron endonuclease
MFYIYVIENKVNGGIYVGKTKDMKRRWGQHVKSSLHESPKTKLQRAMKKYGVENFEMRVVDESDDEKHALNVLERSWIRKLKDEGRDVYNLTEGGEGNVGYVPTPETRKKLSLALKGNVSRLGMPHSEETKRKLSNIHRGRKFTDEHKKKLSEARRKRPKVVKEPSNMKPQKQRKPMNRRPMSEAAKQKLREVNTGKTVSEAARKKISEKLAGRPKPPRSKEHCEKLSAAARARGPMSEEQKAKISESLKASSKVGHSLDDETKAKIGAAQKGRKHSDEEKKKRTESIRKRNEEMKARGEKRKRRERTPEEIEATRTKRSESIRRYHEKRRASILDAPESMISVLLELQLV